ncbi:RNA polymerase sigma factor RpoD/SigA [Rubrobacter taiwanensis]|jgi:RNA polymerase primary sigma factor|uniref:RNA polymerase sigma factor n=1 Tax=Rubrobacter taiwanensis TaxID=185139 RepID=A0A4V2NX97_9ACTN|nr:RNA polymerase sigma factor RpoD/SigA [Rubrobacter taiwanensis]TCJ20442.1 RNA polymerase sigma factor RpoD/SigA [Rubrobacter taiwanensis]
MEARYWEGERSALSDYMVRISSRPLLTPEEERELGRRIREGDEEAWRKLVEHNLRLVVSLARPYAMKGAPLADVIQAGNLGLMRAARSFDPDRGTRFATYAGWWIRQHIQRALPNESGNIRIPEHIERQKRQGLIDDDLPYTVSLESPIGDDGTLGELIPDQRAEEIDNAVTGIALREALKELPGRDARVLAMRYGLDGVAHSFTEIGRALKVTSTRARQLHDRAIKNLRTALENPAVS